MSDSPKASDFSDDLLAAQRGYDEADTAVHDWVAAHPHQPGDGAAASELTRLREVRMAALHTLIDLRDAQGLDYPAARALQEAARQGG